MDKNELKKGFEVIINSLFIAEENKIKPEIEKALKKIEQSGYDISNPEKFNLNLGYKLERILKGISKNLYKIENVNIKDRNKPSFIFTQYSFLEHNITSLCVLKEGSGCSADKSRFILNMYLNYSLTGEIPEFDPSIEKFYIPKVGTYQEWMDLCDGLYNLYYGKTEKYLKAYHKLVTSEKRTYKHILYRWFIKFKDGEEIEINPVWDKEKNPLEEEFFDKGDYYIYSNMKFKHRNYEEYKDEEEFIKYYCKIPKDDILEIYSTSEEKMV